MAITVSNVEELYAAVNDSNNANATVQLKAGYYTLTPRYPNGEQRPNGGSLFLQPGMALVGQNVYHFDDDGDQVPDPREYDGDGVADLGVYADPLSETIIDGSQLDVVLPVPPGDIVSGPIVVVGPVEVSISNCTVRGGSKSQAEIEIRGPGNGSSKVTVRECTLESGRRGILADSALRWNSNNATVNLLAERNVIRNHLLPDVLVGWGIHALPANVSGAKFVMDLRNNRFRRNKINLFLVALGTQHSDAVVLSSGNVYENSRLLPGSLPNSLSSGIFMFIRDVAANQLGSHGNRIRLRSGDDAIWNNQGWAGVSIEGIERASSGTEIKDNQIDVELLLTRFVKFTKDEAFDGPQNHEVRLDLGKTREEQPIRRRDMLILGANNSGTERRELPPEELTGPASDNKVKVKVKRATSSRRPTDYDPNPRPFMKIDNAPDQVEVELELEEIDYVD